MDRDNNDSETHSPSALNKSDTDQSLVGKFKSHVSGIINNTPLSKWFRKNDEKTFRSRDDDQDEELYQMQPPLKKVKHTSTSEQEYHFSTPTLNVPKSTFTSFPEPVAGPSGIKSRKLLTTSTTLTTTSRNTFNTSDLLNGHKDSDSEESTSGYSSVARISSKEQVFESRDSSKQTSPLENSPTNSRSLFTNKANNMSRSLFNDSNMSPRLNTSLSTRRPSFNVSTFGSPNFVDKTLSTRKITNSPFYSGRTGYGGAAAYGRRTTNRLVSDLRKPPTNSIQIKPVNLAGEMSASLGKTAQRILSTLEQYSSPVNDAKKIPVASKRLRSESKYAGVNPYTVREVKTASNSELQVPSVSDLLKMKQSKERLQESTESVRQLATSSKSALNVETYKISTNDNEQQRHTGKIKNKMTSVRQKVQVEETVEEVPLTPVALPITVLPKFDIQIPAAPPASKIEKIEKTEKPSVPRTTIPLVKARSPIKPLETEPEYKFAKPFVISENLKSIVGINNYKFSEPLSKKLKADGVVIPTFNFNMPAPKPFAQLKPKRNGDNVIKPAEQLKVGSVMDVLGKSTTWECSTCLIRNQAEKTKCVACEAGRPAKKESGGLCQGVLPKTSLSFTSNVTEKFKVENGGTWECDTCLVRNKNEAAKCVACETSKPGAKPREQATNLFDKFKQPEGAWECGSCLVRNKSDVDKCVACETTKPVSTGFGDKFKTKDNEWECSVCMVKNPASNTKCLCCEALSPNSKATETATMKSLSESKPVGSFNFGIDKSTAQSFSFGVPPSAVAAATTPSTTIASIFGSNTKVDTQPATSTFSFGIPAEKPTDTKEKDKEPASKPVSKVEDSTTTTTSVVTTTTTTTTPTFNFTTKPVNGDNTPKTPSFSFGTKSETPKSTSGFTLPAVSAAPTFNFNAPKAAESTASQQQSQEVAKAPMFKFGSGVTSTTSEANAFEPAAKVANGFGVSTPAAANFNNSTTAPSFGTTANFSSESKTFSFNANNKTVKEAPVFSFGQPAAATPAAATGGFNFNAPAAAPSTGMFNFNAPKPELAANPAPANPAPMFGAPSTVKNGTAFNFGASGPNNNNQKAGFSFGASLNGPAQPAPSGGFNFGAAPAAAPPTGGFNFNAAPPTFDANVKPSFNFSQGQAVTGFSAQPTAGADVTGQRKIRKAVRRTQR